MGKKTASSIVSVGAVLLLAAMAVSVKLGFRKVDTYEVSKIEKVYKGTDDVRYFVFTDKGVLLIELSGLNAYPYGLQVIKDLGTFTMETRGAIMESGEYRNLTQAEIQDAFTQGINGSYGDFFGITATTLTGFLKAYLKTEKWQKAKAIIYANEKKEEEEKQRKLDKAYYEKKLHGFKMPFWPTTRGKKRTITAEESEAHRKLIEQQREEILKAQNNGNQ